MQKESRRSLLRPEQIFRNSSNFDDPLQTGHLSTSLASGWDHFQHLPIVYEVPLSMVLFYGVKIWLIFKKLGYIYFWVLMTEFRYWRLLNVGDEIGQNRHQYSKVVTNINVANNWVKLKSTKFSRHFSYSSDMQGNKVILRRRCYRERMKFFFVQPQTSYFDILPRLVNEPSRSVHNNFSNFRL